MAEEDYGDSDYWAVAVYDYAPTKELLEESGEGFNILSVRAGTLVLVQPRAGEDWWPAALEDGNDGKRSTHSSDVVGFLPKGYLQLKPLGWDPGQHMSTLKKHASGAVATASASANDVASDASDADGFDDDDDVEIAVGLYAFTASKPSQLSFEAGEEMYVDRSSGGKWWPAEKGDGQKGLIPSNYVQIVEQDDIHHADEEEEGNAPDGDDEGSSSSEDENLAEKGEEARSVAICQYDFGGRNMNELSFSKGDFVWIRPVKGKEWWDAINDRGEAGVVPRNYIKVIKVGEEGYNSTAPFIRSTSGSSGVVDTGRARSDGSVKSNTGPTLYKNKSYGSVNSMGISDLLGGGKYDMSAVRGLLFFRVLWETSGGSLSDFQDMLRDSDIFEVVRSAAGDVLHDGRALSARPPAVPDGVLVLYVMFKGSAAIELNNVKMSSITEGQWFGQTFAVMHTRTVAAPLPSTLRATEYSTMIALSWLGLKIMEERFPVFHQALLEVGGARLSESLQSSRLARSLSPEQLDIVGSLMTFKSLKRNEAVFRSSAEVPEPSKPAVFFVVSGSIALCDGRSETFGRGGVFGEEALDDGGGSRDAHVRGYTAVSQSSPTVLLCLSSAALAAYARADPDVSEALKDSVVFHVSADALAKLPLFASVALSKLEGIAQQCRVRILAKGEKVISAGDTGNDFYIIETGLVKVEVPLDQTKNPSRRMRPQQVTLGPNDYFGELAVLHREARSATVVIAQGPCRMIVLGGDAFRSVLQGCPQIKRDLLETVTARSKQAPHSTRLSIKRSSRNLSESEKDSLGTTSDGAASGGASGTLDESVIVGSQALESPTAALESTDVEWFTATPEQLSALPQELLNVTDQDSIDALTTWQLLGERMQECQKIFESWPCYIFPPQRIPAMFCGEENEAKWVILLKVKLLDPGMPECTIKCNLCDTVGSVMDDIFKKIWKQNASSHSEQAQQGSERSVVTAAMLGPEYFGLKVASRNDFFVNREVMLKQHKHVAEVCRQSPNSSVVKLTMALVDLRIKPSSNGSGVFLSKQDAQSCRACRSESVSSNATHRTSGSESVPEFDTQAPSSPPPLGPINPSQLPGTPRLSASKWTAVQIRATRDALAVPSTWQEVNRSMQMSVRGDWPFRVRLLGLEGASNNRVSSCETLIMRVQLVYAAEVLETRFSRPFRPDAHKPDLNTLRLDEFLWFRTPLARLPLTTRICVTLCDLSGRAGSADGTETLIAQATQALHADEDSQRDSASNMMPYAGAALQLFDQRHQFRSGQQRMVFWPGQKGDKRLHPANHSLQGRTVLVAEFDSFSSPVYKPAAPRVDPKQPGQVLSPVNSPSHAQSSASYNENKNRNNSSENEQDRAAVATAFSEKSIEATKTLNTAPPLSAGSRQKRSPSGGKRTGLLNRLMWGGSGGEKVNTAVSATPAASTSPPFSTPGKKQGENAARTSLDREAIRQQIPVRGAMQLPDSLSPQAAEILRRDPLQGYSLSKEEKAVLWGERTKLLTCPCALPRMMYAVDWLDGGASQAEALNLLSKWEQPGPFECLELLDCVQGELRVREYAVRCLEGLSDEELTELMIQLAQVLKYEPYHDSPLARFLLRRAWLNPREIGTKLFWSLRAEMHNSRWNNRFGLLLRSYTYNSSKHHLQDLTQQVDVQNLLQEVAKKVHGKFSKMERLNFLRAELRKVDGQLPPSFQLPLDPKVVASGLEVDSCKVMTSKKRPLWLKFKGVDPLEAGGESKLIMFKAGDDLRQDATTLIIMRFMNEMWLQDQLDLKMTLYGCVSTGDDLGYLEIVTDSETTAGIQKKHGKLGALSVRSLREWLQDVASGDFNTARDNFVRSCAGYCVATYVLGIGDRHSDNIMIKRDGKLFHIDFGHFLGHFKSKFGIKRERAPFVFTKEMAYVMGGKNEKPYKFFIELCGKAYNVLRRNGNRLITLFKLMIPAGMPELQKWDDIQYMCDKLALDVSDERAAEAFKQEIKNSLNDTYRRVDNLIHNLKTA